MRITRALSALACTTIAWSCAHVGSRTDAPAERMAARQLADPRRCALAIAARTSAGTHAVRCAEWFVARNGYTDLPPADSAALASESVEDAGSLAELLATRRNTLDRRAAVVCRDVLGRPGFTVGFARPGDRERRTGRAVTMDTSYGALRVEHRELVLGRVLADSARCRVPVG